MPSRATAPAPPPVLDLAGHPVRWRLLSELARSDRRVDELTELVGQSQPLVSYHLRRLGSAGMVSSRRSAKDRRAVYYRARLECCGAALAAVGPALHPGLHLQAPPRPDLAAQRRRLPVGVLFACTGNSARSQIAEALLRRSAGAAVHVVSGGSHPRPVHPHAITVMAERGIDISRWRSKPLGDLTGERLDYVITLCDKVRERCPEFPGAGARLHWSIADPSASPSGSRVSLARFRHVAAELDERIGWLIWSISERSRNMKEVHDDH
jgi:ArsR family transcriptional regulator, arsenate/arsenite/antimonite-responsive transcriptional repressor / arsenate reductase (thioredoxin)